MPILNFKLLQLTFPKQPVFIKPEVLEEIQFILSTQIAEKYDRLDSQISENFDERTGCELYNKNDYIKDKLADFLTLNYQIICKCIEGICFSYISVYKSLFQ